MVLHSLRIQNFALLEEVTVEFGTGLNILTGETGAGKSILIGALGTILGQRVLADVIRSGCDFLRVEAVFSIEENSVVSAMLAEQEIEYDDELIIVRKVSRAGKSSILVNGAHVTLTFLKKLAPHLVDIHGQNENLALLREEAQRSLLEGGDADLAERLCAYQDVYRAWKARTKEREMRTEENAEIAERLDMLRWQEQEIAEAELTEGEDEELETEIRRLSHAERLVEHAAEASNLLSEDTEEGAAVLTALSRVTHALEEIARYDESLAGAQAMIEEAYISLQEASYEVRDYLEGIDADPASLDKIQLRMDVIERLKKKYGGSISAVLARLEALRTEISSAERYDMDIEELNAAIARLRQRMEQCAAELTKQRQKVGAALSAKIERELQGLGMKQARFTLLSRRRSSIQPMVQIVSRCCFPQMSVRRKSLWRKSPRVVNSRALHSPSSPSLRHGIPMGQAWCLMKSTRGSAGALRRWSQSGLRSSRSISRCSASRICRRSPAWRMCISISQNPSSTERQ